MPNPLDLKARIILSGQVNAKPLATAIQRQLSNINVGVKLKLDSRANASIDTLNKKLLNLNNTLQTVTLSMVRFDGVVKSMGTSFAKLSEIRQTANSLNTFEKKVESTRKVTFQARNEIENFGKQAALAIRRFSAFTIAVGAVFGFVRAIHNATSEAIAFDKQLTKIAQVTGVSKKNLSPLVSEITRLSTSLGVSSTELIDVAQTLAQAGLSANNTRRALEALAKSSLAPSFVDIKNTTEAAIAAMAQFNLEARDLEDVLGSINSISAAFATEAEDLTKVIRISGGVFASASNKLEEPKKQLNELLALFTSVRSTTRVSAENIATGFNTIFSRLQRPATIEFLRNFNVELTDAQGKFVGVFEAVNRLNKGLAQFKTGDLQFAAIIEQLGGFRQVKNVIPLIQQFDKAQKALNVGQDKNRNLTKDQIIAQESLANAISRVKEEFLAFVRGLTETGTFQVITRSLLSVASAAIRVGETLKPILPIIAALSAVKLGISTLQFAGGFVKELGGGNHIGSSAGAIGSGLGRTLAGPKASLEKTPNVIALNANTGELRKLTSTIQVLAKSLLSVAGISRIKRAGGGRVIGPGDGTSDSVNARLSNGEYVIKASSARKLGVSTLDGLNRTGRLPKFASGGGFRSNKTGRFISQQQFFRESVEGNQFPSEKTSAAGTNTFGRVNSVTIITPQTELETKQLKQAGAASKVGGIVLPFHRVQDIVNPGLASFNLSPLFKRPSSGLGRIPESTRQDFITNEISSRVGKSINTSGLTQSEQQQIPRIQSNIVNRILDARNENLVKTSRSFRGPRGSLPNLSGNIDVETNRRAFRRLSDRQSAVTLATNLSSGFTNAGSRQAGVNAGVAGLLSGRSGTVGAFSQAQRNKAIAKQLRQGFSPQQASENVDNIFASALRKQGSRVSLAETAAFGGGTRGIVSSSARRSGGLFGSRTPLTESQINARANRRAIVGGTLATAGFVAASQLEGKGAAGSAAASGLSGGLVAGGLVGSLAGGPAGAIAGVTVGVVAALDTFLKETNRLAIEAKEIDFKNSLEKLEEQLKIGTVGIRETLDKADKASAEKRRLENDPNRDLNTSIAQARNSFFNRVLLPALISPTAGKKIINASTLGLGTIINGINVQDESIFDANEILSKTGTTGAFASIIRNLTGGDPLKGVKEFDKLQAERAKEDAKQISEPLAEVFKRQISRGTNTASGIVGGLTEADRERFSTAGIDITKVLGDAQKIRDAESAFNGLRLTISRLTDETNLAALRIQATNSVLQDRIDQEQEFSRTIAGGSLTGSIRSNNSANNILGNLSSFSAGALHNTLFRLQGGGLDAGTANLVRSFKTVDQRLPQILSELNVSQGNPQDVISDFNIRLKRLDIAQPIKDIIIKAFDDALSSEEVDFDIKKAVKDFNPNTELHGLRDAALNSAKGIADRLNLINQNYIESVTGVIQAQENYRTKLLESVEIETNAREKIAQASGGSRLGALTSGLAARNAALGVSGPSGLGARINNLQNRGAQLRELISNAQTPQQAQFFGQQLIGVNDELTKAKAALEVFANGTLEASIAAEKLSRAEEKRGVGREIAGNLLGSNRLGFFKQIQALEKFQGGDLRTLFTNFEDVQSGVGLQAKFLRATGREKEATAVERNFETAIGKVLGKDFLDLFKAGHKEEDEAKKLQIEAAKLQIDAAKETLIAQKAIVTFFSAKSGIVPRASGGRIYGAGTGTSDSIPARLSNGEYVIRAAAAKKIGTKNLDHMNRTGNPFFDIPQTIIGGTKDLMDYFGFARGGSPTYAQIRQARKNAYLQGKANRRAAYVQQRINRAGAYFDRRGIDRNNTRFLRRFSNFRNISRLARPRAGFALGGIVDLKPSTGNGSFGMDAASMASLASFSQAANNLAQSLANVNFPQTISMSGTHNVNVTLNGAAVLQNLLNGPLAGLIQGAIQEALTKYDKDLRS